MPVMTDKEMFSSLKKQTYPMYVLYGEEQFFVSKAVSAIKESLGDVDEFITLDNDDYDYNLVDQELNTFSMLSQKRCILLRDVDFDKMSKADFDFLIKLMSVHTDSDNVLIIYTLCDKYLTKKSTRFKKLLATAEVSGASCMFAHKPIGDVKRSLCERAKRENVTLDMDCAEHLINRCSNDYNKLSQELDKVIMYVQGKHQQSKQAIIDTTDSQRYTEQPIVELEFNEQPRSVHCVITEDDINFTTIPTTQASVFELCDVIISLDYAKSTDMLAYVLSTSDNAIALLGAINMYFIDLYRAGVAISSGASVDNVVADFQYKNRAFAIKKSFAKMRQIKLSSVREVIDLLSEVDYTLKSSRTDDLLIMQTLLSNIFVALSK